MKVIFAFAACMMIMPSSRGEKPADRQFIPLELSPKNTETLLTSSSSLVINPWDSAYSFVEESKLLKRIPACRKGHYLLDAPGPGYWKLLHQVD